MTVCTVEGCNKRHRTKEFHYQRRIRQRKFRESQRGQFNDLKAEAKKRKHTVSLSFEEYKALRVLPCDYCGGKLPRTSGGLDRKDSGESYHLANVVPCCTQCNLTKGA